MSDNDDEAVPILRDIADGSQIIQLKTPHSNSVLRGPEGTDVGDLHVEIAADLESQTLVSVIAWGPTAKQAEWLAAGAHLRMGVWQHPIPPLSLCVESPFCPVCEAPTVYVRSERAFVCAVTSCLAFKVPLLPGTEVERAGGSPSPTDEQPND